MNIGYKKSKYVDIYGLDGKKIIFSTLSGGMIEIGADAACFLEHCDWNALAIREASQPFHDALVEARCLLPEDEDELELIKLRANRDTFTSNEYGLIINPTMACNFDCWYCYENHKPSRMSGEIMDRIYRNVERKIQHHQISKLSIGWFGGEPTLYFKEVVAPLSRRLKDLCAASGIPFANRITTNGYLLTENVIDESVAIELNAFQITVDGTKDVHDKSRVLKGGGPTFDRIMANTNLLLERHKEARVVMRVNYCNEALEDLKPLLAMIPPTYRSRVRVDLQRIWQTFEQEGLLRPTVQGLYQDIADLGYAIADTGFTLSMGIRCYADRWNHATINFDGAVFKCTAREFDASKADGHLQEDGEIIWNNKLVSKRFSGYRFDNPKCLSCNYLPVCTGPCSQKVMEGGHSNIDSICFIEVYELGIEDFIRSEYKRHMSSRALRAIPNTEMEPRTVDI